ncbi:hypothetical protein EPN52_13585 [bacterium]|nr:MAG: hypothetical protein EPN52_13585 [bacterium]
MLFVHKHRQRKEMPVTQSIFAGRAGLDVCCSVRVPGCENLVNITISAFPNVAARAEALGIDLATALLILPSNFETAASRSEFAYDSSTSWLSGALTDARISYTVLLPSRVSLRKTELHAQAFRNRVAGTAELPILCTTPQFVENSFDAFALSVQQLFIAARMAGGKRDADATVIHLVVGPRAGRYVRVTYEGPTTAATPVATAIRNLIAQTATV